MARGQEGKPRVGGRRRRRLDRSAGFWLKSVPRSTSRPATPGGPCRWRSGCEKRVQRRHTAGPLRRSRCCRCSRRRHRDERGRSDRRTGIQGTLAAGGLCKPHRPRGPERGLASALHIVRTTGYRPLIRRCHLRHQRSGRFCCRARGANTQRATGAKKRGQLRCIGDHVSPAADTDVDVATAAAVCFRAPARTTRSKGGGRREGCPRWQRWRKAPAVDDVARRAGGEQTLCQASSLALM